MQAVSGRGAPLEPRGNSWAVSMGLVKWVIATSVTELQVGARLRSLLVRRAQGQLGFQ